jgi:hypothetical protein
MYFVHLLLCVLSIGIHKPHKHIHMYGVTTVTVLSNLNDFNNLIYFSNYFINFTFHQMITQILS